MKHFCSFSEAIREGAKLRPQGFDRLFKDGRTCAVGAGLDAMGVDLDQIGGMAEYANIRDELTPEYSYLFEQTSARCPIAECCSGFCHLQDAILHFNDEHKWTREAIADWLETEEEKIGYVTLTEGERSESSVHSLQTVVVV